MNTISVNEKPRDSKNLIEIEKIYFPFPFLFCISYFTLPLQFQLSLLEVDRQKTCPFMVKMYCRINGHHRLDEFAPPRFPVDDEVIVYTWRDATLLELSQLVRGVMSGPVATDPTLKFSFQLLYPNPHRSGQFISKPLGWAFESIPGDQQSSQIINSSERTLESFRFVPGDMIDVAIYNNPAMIPRPRH